MSFLESSIGLVNISLVMFLNFLMWMPKIIVRYFRDPCNLFFKKIKPLYKLSLKVMGKVIGLLFKIIIIPLQLIFIVICYFPSLKTFTFKVVIVFFWLLIKPTLWLFNIIYKHLIEPIISYFIRIFSVQAINELALLSLNRPAVRSLWGLSKKNDNPEGFTSWETLTDKAFNARNLSPSFHSFSADTKNLTNLFINNQASKEKKDDRTSVLFPFFAQWLTDSFMRIDSSDRRKNSSNHELDLCQIYGLKSEQTDALRLNRGGRLRARYLKAQENTTDTSDRLEWDDDDESNNSLQGLKNAEVIRNNIKQSKFEEYLPLLFEVQENVQADAYSYANFRVKKRYQVLMDKYISLAGVDSKTGKLKTLSEYMENLVQFVSADRRGDMNSIVGGMYATGLERGNASVGYTMFSTLFLREHNRICDELIKNNFCCADKDHDHDEKIFQTARMINTIVYLKIIIQSYINHIGGKKFVWGFYPDKLSNPNRMNFGRIKQQWFKPNWVSLEFNLLYRWHSLVPTFFQLGNNYKLLNYYFHNNGSLEAEGLEECYKAASQQYSNKLCLKNTPPYLQPAVQATLDMGRKFSVAPYMTYYKFYKAAGRIKCLKGLCGDNEDGENLAKDIQGLYGNKKEKEVLEELDFYVGLFAEKQFENKPFGELIFRMVSSDAFTHLYRNPLLSPEIFNRKVLGDIGIEIINNTQSLEDVLLRNTSKKRVVANFGIE